MLSAEKEKRIVSQGRPLALWDERIFTHNQFQEVQMPTDSWGRSIRYSQQFSQKTSQGLEDCRVASSFLEHPVSKDSTSASLILKQFLDNHWKDENIETEVHFDHGANYVFEGTEGQMNTSL